MKGLNLAPFGPGSFAIFYPRDGHKPGCVDRVAKPIKQVVVEVSL